MASERQCGVWVRGSGCVSVRGHKGLHTSAYTASIDALTAENERLRRENAALLIREAVLKRAVEKAADWHSLSPHEFEGKWGRGWEDSPDADDLIESDLRAALAAAGGEGQRAGDNDRG